MAVPDFQSLLLPMLRIASDGNEHRLADVRERLGNQLGLSTQDLEEKLASGRQTKFANRVAWAKVYLVQAGLFRSTRRAHFQIAERGRTVLKAPPSRIDIRFLEQFPEFLEFRTPKNTEDDDNSPEAVPVPSPSRETPEEALEASHQQIKAGLAAEVLTRIKSSTSEFFERLVVDLLIKMGYGGSRREAGQVVGRSGDEGIDGIISEDRLGLDVVYLQAKKWDSTVGRPEIQKFVGALHGRRAKKGVFMTTGTFSSEAQSYVEHIEPRVVLIDGRRLAELMIDFELGVATVRTYHVKRIDSDYFEDE